MDAEDLPHFGITLFIGGLSPQIRSAQLVAYFSRYESLLSGEVKVRPDGTSKGYGFVVYGTTQAVNQVLGVAHVIKGRQVDVSLAEKVHRTLVVKGVECQIHPMVIQTYFENKFGDIVGYNHPFDPVTRAWANVCQIEFNHPAIVTRIGGYPFTDYKIRTGVQIRAYMLYDPRTTGILAEPNADAVNHLPGDEDIFYQQ